MRLGWREHLQAGSTGDGCPGGEPSAGQEPPLAWPPAPGVATPPDAGGAGKLPAPEPPAPPPPPGAASLLRVVPDEQPQGGEVSFGGGVVDGQDAGVRGRGGVPTAVTQQPVHHLGVAEAGGQVQDRGTGIVFVLREEGLLVPPSLKKNLN